MPVNCLGSAPPEVEKFVLESINSTCRKARFIQIPSARWNIAKCQAFQVSGTKYTWFYIDTCLREIIAPRLKVECTFIITGIRIIAGIALGSSNDYSNIEVLAFLPPWWLGVNRCMLAPQRRLYRTEQKHGSTRHRRDRSF